MKESTRRIGFVESLESRTLLTLAGIDTSFSGDGSATFQFRDSQSTIAESLDVQRDGKVVIAGITQGRDKTYQIILARLKGDGSLDRTFADSGRLITSFKDGSGRSIEATAREVR